MCKHLYSTHRDAYKALHHPPFGKSNHNYISVYKQKLKQEAPVTRSIKKGSDEVNAKLQDWNMFWDFSDGIEEEYTTSVTGFINKCINDAVPTVTVCIMTQGETQMQTQEADGWSLTIFNNPIG